MPQNYRIFLNIYSENTRFSALSAQNNAFSSVCGAFRTENVSSPHGAFPAARARFLATKPFVWYTVR
jgi:hypothetical protein